MIELFLTAIPLEEFDQRKLEALVRKIPRAYVRTEAFEGYQKKIYSFPKFDDKGFKIECEADYYLSSEIPSKSACKLNLLEEIDLIKDEHLIEFRDPFVVKSLFNAISYSSDIKKFYSSEKVYGLGLNGSYQLNFRYAFSCTTEMCQLTVSTKSADTH